MALPTQSRRLAGVLAAAGALASCGGGDGTTMSNTQAMATQPAAATNGTAMAATSAPAQPAPAPSAEATTLSQMGDAP